jgi:hypothetical protein
VKHPNSRIGMPAYGPLRTSAFRSARARLRAGRPGRSGIGARPCRPGPLRCSLREGGCDDSALALDAPAHRAFSPAARKRSAAPRSPALLGADNSRPHLPAHSLAGTGGVYSSARETPRVPGPEGSALTGRMGAGEQRSAERGSPVYPPGRREAVRWVPRSAAPTAASQPPSRSEQRSAPSLKARAATPKPRQGTALGPRANAAQRALANVRRGPNAGASKQPWLARPCADRPTKPSS